MKAKRAEVVVCVKIISFPREYIESVYLYAPYRSTPNRQRPLSHMGILFFSFVSMALRNSLSKNNNNNAAPLFSSS